MKKDPKLDRLREVPLFRDCSPRELQRLSLLLDDVVARPGDVLMREGEAGREVFVIAEGVAEVTLRGRKLAVLGPGEVVGEMAALEHQPRSATVTAATPMRLLVAGLLDFSMLVDCSPSVRRRMLVQLSERVRAQESPGAA